MFTAIIILVVGILIVRQIQEVSDKRVQTKAQNEALARRLASYGR